MTLKKVSIYIPAYNAENTILNVINSVINQTYKFDEIIVIDDNSTDLTQSKLKNFERIKIIKNNSNKGLGYNRNLGFKLSTNEIVASIDADVVLSNNWLETMIKHLDDNQGTFIGGKMIEKFTDNNYNKWRAKYYSQNWGNKNLLNPPFLFGCNTIQHKLIWKDVSGYDEKLLTNGEDIDYSKKLSLKNKYKIMYCAEAISEHLQDDDLNTLSKRVWRYHSFAYKIKDPSIYKTIKLSIKQFNFFLKRSIKDLFLLDFKFIYINLLVFVKFMILEHTYYKKYKK